MISSIYQELPNRKPGRRRPLPALALLCLLLGGCQATQVLNGLTPETGFVVIDDVRYGAHPRQALDLYLPRDAPPHRTPLVFVYGGAWQSGNKADYRFVGQAFADLGYATVIPDYRLYPDATFPDFVDDVAGAAAATIQRLGAAGCAADGRVVLVGHSAGAHTAALLAVDPRYFSRLAAPVGAAALVGLAGPYDLPLDDPLVAGKFDRRLSDDEVRPVALADGRAPPALLLHGAADTTVDPRHTARLGERLAAVGVPVRVRLYPGTGHRLIVGALASPLRFLLPVRDDIAAWLQDQGLADRCPGKLAPPAAGTRPVDNPDGDRGRLAGRPVHD